MDRKAYRKLDVWQQGIELVQSIYILTVQLPTHERFSLTSQMQRAAISIPANIAEGYGRMHPGDYIRYLSIARGSLMELETHLIISVRLKLIKCEQALSVWKQLQKIGSMLTSLIRSLQRTTTTKQTSPTLDPRP
jgi:four helix bundle protein